MLAGIELSRRELVEMRHLWSVLALLSLTCLLLESVAIAVNDLAMVVTCRLCLLLFFYVISLFKVLFNRDNFIESRSGHFIETFNYLILLASGFSLARQLLIMLFVRVELYCLLLSLMDILLAVDEYDELKLLLTLENESRIVDCTPRQRYDQHLSYKRRVLYACIEFLRLCFSPPMPPLRLEV